VPRTITTIDDLHSYLTLVMERTQDHASEVEQIILAMAGAVILKKDVGTPIEVGTYRGNTANLLWVIIKGQRYVFTYDHNGGRVIIRQGSTQGQEINSFNNETTMSRLIRIFNEL